MIYSPCKNCEDRHIDCHSKCENYLAFRSERDSLMNLRNEKKMNERLIGNYIDETIQKIKKRK